MIKKILIMTFVLSFLYSCSELKDKFSDDTEKKDQIIENNIQIEEKNQTNNVNVESIEITKENIVTNVEVKDIEKEIKKIELKRKIKEKKTIEKNIKDDLKRSKNVNDLRDSFSLQKEQYCKEKYKEDIYMFSNCILLNIIYIDELSCNNSVEKYKNYLDEYGDNIFIYNIDECNNLVDNMNKYLKVEMGKNTFNSINNSIFGKDGKNIFINLLYEKNNENIDSDENSSSN